MAAKKIETATLPADFLASVEIAREAARRGDPGPARRLREVTLDELRRLEDSDRTDPLWPGDYVEMPFNRFGRLTRPMTESRRQLIEIAKLKSDEALGVIKQANKRTAVALPEGHAFATPETQAKVRVGRKGNATANMKLTPHQRWAAEEIQEVIEFTVRALMSRALPLDAIRVDGNAGFDVFRGMPERIAQAHAARYLPWAHRNGAYLQFNSRGKVRTVPITGVGLVFRVLIGGEALRDLAPACHVRTERMLDRFKRLLDDYGRRATS